MIEFILNDKKVTTDLPSGSLLLDFIRYEEDLKGTKIGCREGDCGACTVLIGEVVNGKMKYSNVTSCLTPIANVQGKHVVSIEGLNLKNLTPVQQYMVDEAGTQCGFCTTGFVVSLTSFCLTNETPTYEDAIASINGNICRCTGYKSIERAALHITESLKNKSTDDIISWLVEHHFIPDYFTEIQSQLSDIQPVKIRENAKILVGGGTDLYVQQHEKMVELEITALVQDEKIRFIKFEDDICTLGAATTVSDMWDSPELNQIFPKLKEHLKLVSSQPIRNISTIAGNFVNASPIGDMTAFFLALNSSITLEENGKQRTILLKDLYLGYKDLDKTENEVITQLSFEIPTKNTFFNLEKVSKRTHLDIASVNSALKIELKDDLIQKAFISAGGVGPIPMVLSKTGVFLVGKEINAENIKAANEILQTEISPMSDVRGTEEYKRLLLRQLFYAHFMKLFPEKVELGELVIRRS
ncbi:MAG: FAD binding domain-containing protein [Fluviicola sp.]|nr:FAD binding domain-containing protein [Fluviicola sp.]